jgi:hypothetical protein
MPTLPWTPAQVPEPPEPVVVLGSQLRLRSYRHVPSFLLAAMKIRKQVLASPGAVGVTLIAQPARKTFWTLSAWTDEAAMAQFVRAAPHVGIMQKFHDRLAGTAFAQWELEPAGLPKKLSNAKELWDEARTRLAPQLEAHRAIKGATS